MTRPLYQKPVYETFTIDRPVAAPRQVVWDALLDLIGRQGYESPGDPPPHGAGSTIRFSAAGYELLERTVSLEPPWRRVYQHVEGAPARFAQGSIAIRDDGPTSHLAWALVVEPLPDGSTAPFLEAARQVIERAVELVASAAEAAVSGGRP